MRAKLWTHWTWFREWPRTRSWAWDGVHVEAQNKDKVVGVGRGTRQSPRHYKIICEDFIDAKRGFNFVNWESTVKIFKIWVFCIERIIFKIRIICIECERICVEHHLISRTYRMGCDGRDDCGGPRSNAVDWATQVSQQSTRYQGCEAELIGTSSSNMDWIFWPKQLWSIIQNLNNILDISTYMI